MGRLEIRDWAIDLITPKAFPHPPNGSYQAPDDSYRRRTVPTIAERFLPPPNGLYQAPNGPYRRRMVPNRASTKF
ncbi:MAG: hypothetical protein H6631_00495 [Anaerolineaceae bacterium]|nr:hypothetical protein [Anaerolineaceae bacterium]MCB9100273.1 hypothetical protein [Anaerolineales bacterium]